MRQEVLTGIERRRRWSIEEKLRILGEVGERGATVADVARRHDISRQHIYQWRVEMRRRGEAPVQVSGFLPVELAEAREDENPIGMTPDERRVEIGLRSGRVVRVVADIPEALLARVIRVAESA